MRGTRGVWHNEVVDATLDEVVAQCRAEFAHVDEQLQRSTDIRLKHFVVVEITERDVETVTE
jgi:succinylarginine dihydrolase